MADELMKIGEIAAFFGISVKAVRVYEKKGIITPSKIDPVTGYRYYTYNQVQTLNALIELKAMGFSLNEIKKIISGGIGSDELKDALDRKRAAWLEAISAAENKINAIDSITARIADSVSVDVQGMTEEERVWYLVKMVCVEDIRAQSALSEALWL